MSSSGGYSHKCDISENEESQKCQDSWKESSEKFKVGRIQQISFIVSLVTNDFLKVPWERTVSSVEKRGQCFLN